MNNYLQSLSIEILRLYPSQSKVKFAKLIYFVHKELVRSELVKTSELAFIRMPLGPVPDGFMELEKLDGIKIKNVVTQLMYNSQVYEYNGSKITPFSEIVRSKISTTLKPLSIMSTTSIVDLAHKEYSWMNNQNSVRYFINDQDLTTVLPVNTSYSNDNETDLQERLVDGMISDIVDSSTALEYPEDDL